MKRWEYHITKITPRSALHQPDFYNLINRLGDSGWELVEIVPGETNYVVIFKRDAGHEYGPAPAETVGGPTAATVRPPDSGGRGGAGAAHDVPGAPD